MKKNEKVENKEEKKSINDEDEIKFLKKYRNLDVSNKILICLYILIILTIINMVLPYIVAFVSNKFLVNKNSSKYDTSMFKTISGADIEDIGSSDQPTLLFVCSENYQECHDFIGVMQQAQYDYGYVTNYLVADDLNIEDNVNALLEYDNDKKFIKDSLGQLPIVLVLKDGKLIEGWTGVSSYDNFKDFLKISGMIE